MHIAKMYSASCIYESVYDTIWQYVDISYIYYVYLITIKEQKSINQREGGREGDVTWKGKKKKSRWIKS